MTAVSSRTRRNRPETRLRKPAIVRREACISRLQNAFLRTTGWGIEFAGGESSEDRSPSTTARPASIRLRRDAAGNARGVGRRLERDAAVELARAAGQVVRTLDEMQAALREREAELAAGVPVTRRKDEPLHLAKRLEAILRSGGRAIGCQGAAIYLLDDTAQQLKLRACWGLSARRFLQPPRALSQSAGDLEALVGHVVAIEDVPRMRQWSVPEPALAAICVPISTPTEPLGTLWFFCRQQRPFTAEQTHLTEILAGRVAAELQREVLLEQAQADAAWHQEVQHAGSWQRDHAPQFGPLLADWQVQGVATGPTPIRTGFYDWYPLEDESLGFAMGYGEGTTLSAAMTTVQLQATVRAHTQYPHDAATLVQRVNETMWQSSVGGHFAALAYGKLEPRRGRVELCTAGRFLATLVEPGGAEPISLEASPLLAMQTETAFPCQTIDLGKQATFVLARGGEQAGQFSRRAAEQAATLTQLAALLVEGQVGLEQTAVLMRRKASS